MPISVSSSVKIILQGGPLQRGQIIRVCTQIID
jgi:hypothetical protein